MHLTAREVEILALASEGLSNPAIGDVLWLSGATVKSHFHKITQKMPATPGVVWTRVSLVAWAIRNRVIP